MAVEIPFIPNQDPSFIKQGQGTGKYVNPLGQKSDERTDHYLLRSDQIAGGDQPIMGGKDLGDKWYKEQLRDLITAGLLPEHLKAYVREPELHYLMGLNPVPQKYTEDRDSLYKDLKDRDVKNVRIAGDRHALYRDFRGHDMEAQIDSSSATVVIPGELLTLKEMCQIIDQKLAGKMLDHPLIIENVVDAVNKGLLDQSLRGIKILNFEEGDKSEPHLKRQYVDLNALAHDYGIYISEDRDTTLKMAKDLTPAKTPPVKLNDKPFIPNGSILFVATGTQKKYDEIAAVCRAQGIQVDVRPIYELVGTYVGPIEDKRTYQGNVQVKMKAAFDAWHAMDETSRTLALKHNGIEKKQAFIIAEDSGFHFEEPGLSGHSRFRKIYHTLDPDAPFPGVETGPSTIGSDGIMGFMKKIERIFSDRRSPNYGVTKKSLIGIAPLEQERYGAMDMHMVSSEVKGQVTFNPMPPPGKTGAIEIDNYLIPDIASSKRKLTEAQLGDAFYLEHSPRALAMRAIAQEMRIPIDKSKPFEQVFSKDFRAGIVVDDHSYAGKHVAEEFSKAAHADGFSIINTPSRFERPIDVQKNILENNGDPVDGIVFAFDPKLAQQDFWRNIYLFTSMIVAEQTHDKYKLKKPFYLVNPKEGGDKGAFDYLVDLVTDFHHNGTVSESPTSLYKLVETIEEAITGLKEDRKKYRRFVLPPHALKEEMYDPVGRDGTKDFNVAIFCSATNKNSTNMAHARDITNKLVDDGFGIVSGGGMYASMGAVTDVVKERRREGAEHLTSNAVHIMPGEGDVSKPLVVTQFQKARNIYERMEYMIDKSDAFAIMPGGTGTIQEFALLALLKKRHLELDDEYAREKMQHKEIFVINPPMETNKARGFYQKLKEIIDINDPTACEKLGIHFVPDQETALEEIHKLREAKRERTGWAPPPGYTTPAMERVGRGGNGHGNGNGNGGRGTLSVGGGH